VLGEYCLLDDWNEVCVWLRVVVSTENLLIAMEVELNPMKVPTQMYLKILYCFDEVPILYRNNFTVAYEGIDGNSTLQRGALVWRSDSVVTGVRIHVTVIG
jgi:hypothetical protein